MNENMFDVIILGGGAAGLTAGIYTSRAKLKTLILNEGVVGGQMVLTDEIANYPGVENINGFQLARIMKKQAKTFGCTIKSNIKITRMELDTPLKTVEVNNKTTYSAKAVIIASGGRARNLNVPGEKDFQGSGISYCATCDGDFFQDKEIIVVGGGNSALEEAVSLTKYASKVTIVHEFDHFQAYPSAVDEAKNNDKIHFIMESTIAAFKGEDSLKTAVIRHIPSGKESDMTIDGVFIFIGYVPNTEPFKGLIALNERKEIIADDLRKTDVDGVFAAGDCLAKRYRQVTTAVADGTIAALSAIEYVNQ